MAVTHGERRRALGEDVCAEQRGLRILVIEDEPRLARMASLVLTQGGHEVVISGSGADALTKLQRGQFELILSDFDVGSAQHGWDLARTVRERWPGTRYVLVAGWSAGIDPVEARTRGVYEVLAKPYRIADLRQLADRVAGGLSGEAI